MLIIEVDGITHYDAAAQKKDEQRTKDLAEVGFTVLRFSDWEVINRMEDVSIIIGTWIDENSNC